jgi:aldose 1-epimerase
LSLLTPREEIVGGRWRITIRAVLVLVVLMANRGIAASPPSQESTVARESFGHVHGVAVERFSLRNRRGMQAQILTYGGIITSLKVPDRNGHLSDVVLGFDNLDGYLHGSPYFGALVGRYANRIANARFGLDGRTYMLAHNDGSSSLHGGLVGFDKRVWSVDRAAISKQGPQLTLSYLSPDGEEGYPGTLHVTAVYTLTDDNALSLEFTATTDRDTVVNLTQHSYFNLRGWGDVLGHVVQINADRFTPVDATLIPTGKFRSVEGTPFDFRKSNAIGARLVEQDKQLQYGKGYDHNWVINGPTGEFRQDATIYEPTSGRVLEVWSNQPGLQFYTGNVLDGTIVGKEGWRYTPRSAFCMEPQHYPDAPNHLQFPSTVLRPGEIYRNVIVYRFSAR